MTTQTTESSSNSLPPELRALLETRDAEAFEASLDTLFARRQQDLFRSLGHLTRDLHESIMRLTRDGDQPASNAVNARLRLQEALAMSTSAAHENLAMTERLRPQATQLRDQARALASTAGDDPAAAQQLAQHSEQFADSCLGDFTRLVESQSWQDLSGQRLQQVSCFIDRVEAALLELVRLTGSISGGQASPEQTAPRVTTQDDVDRLLSDFGF